MPILTLTLALTLIKHGQVTAATGLIPNLTLTLTLTGHPEALDSVYPLTLPFLAGRTR